METIRESVQYLDSRCVYGEVLLDGTQLYWYYEDSSEDQDILWDAYCTDVDRITRAGYRVESPWSDNNSTGFDIFIN